MHPQQRPYASPAKHVAWDAIILTAADEQQAQRYRLRLAGACAESTLIVVADPNTRLGSGGATLHALLRAAEALPGGLEGLSHKRLLMLHSGGDSRRLPQFSVTGKVCAPLPLAVSEGPARTLFDELVSALSRVFCALESGLVVSSGDVLLRWQDAPLDSVSDGILALGFRGEPDQGSRHGVYVRGATGEVLHMLQKAPPEELERVATDDAGKVVIDSGVLAFAGEGLRRALEVARALYQAPEGPLPAFDLYRDLACALAERTDQEAYLTQTGPNVRSPREARQALWRGLRGLPFTVHTPESLEFLHFGTTAEYFAMVRDASVWESDPRHDPRAGAWPSAQTRGGRLVCLDSVLEDSGSAGAEAHTQTEAVVVESRLGARSRLSNGCVVGGVHDPEGKLQLRPGVAACQVPLSHQGGKVIMLLYGVDDNPKAIVGQPEATLFGRPLEEWLIANGLRPDDVWPEVPRSDRSLWNAQLYAVHSLGGSWDLALWLQDESAPPELIARWFECRRLSMADVSAQADHHGVADRRSELAARLCVLKAHHLNETEPRASMQSLFERLPDAAARRRVADALEELAAATGEPLVRARVHRAAGDVLLPLVTEDSACANRMAHHHQWAFRCVREAVEGGGRGGDEAAPPASLSPGVRVVVECPVRVDLAGGWTDTPPFSLEWGGAVLNVALTLEGRKPISAEVLTSESPELCLAATDQGLERRIESLSEALAFDQVGDAFSLQKGALALLGMLRSDGPTTIAEALTELGAGVTLTTRSAVPKGSGLGTSSILGAAILAALGAAAGRQVDQPELFDLVLRLEQMLTTGGGWQDQVGGVVGGVKVVRSQPGSPQRPVATPIPLRPEVRAELHQRMVLFYTGEKRVAKNILQVVVGRCLSRDPEVIETLTEMPPLVEEMRSAFEAGNLTRVGERLSESWRQKQVLNAHSTNPWIDHLFAETRDLCDGGKLAGAGGGGFLVLMGKTAEAAARLRARLSKLAADHGGRVYEWSLDEDGMVVRTTP